MPIILDGSNLTVEKLVAIARYNEKVELQPEALERIKICRAMLEEKINAHEIMYGVNTGIGEFSEVVLNDDQVKEFQKYLIYNHAAGIGDPAPVEYVRGAMAGRINVHAHGMSGCRPEITLTLIEMLNKEVTPVVCQKGSVGACGDLAPMSQVALLMMGEGEAYYKGEKLPGKIAFEKAGIIKPGVPVVVAPQKRTVEDVLRRTAEKNTSRLVQPRNRRRCTPTMPARRISRATRFREQRIPSPLTSSSWMRGAP